eukprot:UN26271
MEIWNWAHLMADLDKKKGENGHALDEFEAHRFLEKRGETLTVIAMRKRLAELDLDKDHCMSLLEYAVSAFKDVNLTTLMDRPQGTNKELEDATRKLEDALAVLENGKNEKALEKSRKGRR